MEITFEPGDIVKLKSAGPEPSMTINSKTVRRGSDEIQYECFWFHDRELHSAVFAHAALRPVEPIR